MENIKNEMTRIREDYSEIMRQELLGPGSEISIPDAEHEIITEFPEERYTLGVLFPPGKKMNADSGNTISEEEDTTAETEGESDDIDFESGLRKSLKESGEIDFDESDNEPDIEENNLDEEISLASQNKPSSMGIIFLAEGNTDKIVCTVKFGTYRRALISELKVPFYPEKEKEFSIPPELAQYVLYDRSLNLIKINTAGKTDIKLSSTIVNNYAKEIDKEESDPVFIDCLYKLAAQVNESFIRVPHEKEVEIVFKENYSDDTKRIDGTDAKISALRREIRKGLFSVSIMLVNNTKNREKGINCLFQPEIIVESEKNNFRFSDYSGIENYERLSLEELSLEMQYRNKKKYATGMGAAAGWKIDNEGNGYLYTDLYPHAELPGMRFELPEKYDTDKNALKMKYLSDLNSIGRQDKIKALKTIVNAYEKWIEELKEKKEESDELNSVKVFGRAAEANISGCEKSCQRMKEGLNRLSEDDTAWEAFELANRAMFMQRAHIKMPDYLNHNFDDEEDISDFLWNIDYKTIDETVNDFYAWRPFQIAFILMSINSIAEGDCPDKNLVDLIWFPTGGGKTEAYLGLTAFVIFYRRLRYPNECGGTSVIMRYTLRLLTAQQFTRASTLICACEYIRMDAASRKPLYGRHNLGSEPITIGLWIGGEHTPNTISDALSHESKLSSVKNAGSLRYILPKHNKFQVLKCPWCGQSLVKHEEGKKLIGQWGYIRKKGHVVITCTREGCFFNGLEKLPIEVVDEELYKKPPTLLFGTVDKFAMMPWNGKIGSFFGIGRNARSPELIIQDELHLISGPLGTMVGIYESAIDGICRSNGNTPKIIASTATIRGAHEQCSGLYNREVAQFPHPGLDADDTFFARESIIDHENGKYGRKYIGLMPSGKSKAMAEDRVISALMQRVKMMDITDSQKDLLWTLVVYFNSLKELGKCSTLVEDDIVEFIERIAKRHGLKNTKRQIGRADELTSRVGTSDLNETLDKLEKARYQSEYKPNQQHPSDIVLATNMISVGIDVARLNVMVMVGQPKLTSEYIQASSRVGREYPGLVFILYDGTKSRDRSHYEQFIPYHYSFYKFVEPTAVTPFAKPARDRALHAVLIAMIRNLIPDLQGEKDAGEFSRTKYNAVITRIKDFILEREQGIVSRLSSQMDDDSDEIEEEIERIFSKWNNEAEYYGDKIKYGESAMMKALPPEEHRLLASHGTRTDDYVFETMTSMRNVDSALQGEILIWESDYGK